MRKIFPLTMAVLLFGALSWAALGSQAATSAAPTKTTKKARMIRTRVASGKVVSASATELVIVHKVKGNEENSTYKLNADTKKEGDPAAGNRVTVHYTTEGEEDVATLVKVSAPRMEKASPAQKATDSAPPRK